MDLTEYANFCARLGYFSDSEKQLIDRAFKFAYKRHYYQLRASGDPYIVHPLAVARILISLHCDCATIAAALLHDVLEDTETTYEELELEFGGEIAHLVEGLTKINQLDDASLEERQARNFYKIIVAISQDIRVIIIKLADRLHNMRTIRGLPRGKRKRIAQETLELYTPIARQLGLYLLRKELDELAFAVLYPEQYRVIRHQMQLLDRSTREEVVSLMNELKNKLLETKQFQSVAVQREMRNVYDVYRKLAVYCTPSVENLDIFSFKVILSDGDDCYSALGVIHRLFKPIPGKFKDYIADAKLNGYQALHTVLLGANGYFVRIRIFTVSMERLACLGVAAYWVYQDMIPANESFYETTKSWLNKLSELRHNADDPKEFLNDVKGSLYSDKIYVFTPQGERVVLAQGATVLDFAYALHTDLGNSCVAAKINQHSVDLSSVLENGEIVTLITDPQGIPDVRWLSVVKSNRARQKIRQFLRSLSEEEIVKQGLIILEETFEQIGYDLQTISVATFNEVNQQGEKELYRSLGLGLQLPMLIAYQLINWERGLQDRGTVIQNISGIPIRFARCCYPVAGDSIGGYLNSRYALDIHRRDCPVLRKLGRNPKLVVDTAWQPKFRGGHYHVLICFSILNKKEYLDAVKKNINALQGKIHKLVSGREYRGGYISVELDLVVTGLAQLTRIIHRIEKLPSIIEVKRKAYHG